MSKAKAKRPGAGVKASPGSASRISGRARRCGLLPPIADYGFLSHCHTDALVAPWNLSNMTIIVSDGKTPVAAGAK
jgi:hypothetical protein